MNTTIELLFASQNKNKVIEIQSALAGKYVIKSLNEVGFKGELNEPYDTFEANAKIKAKQGYEIFGLPCFAEDAGLVIKSLNGKPGVLSARYAGEDKNHQFNIEKVLSELKGNTDRTAFFIACIAFHDGKDFYLFEGKVLGQILTHRQGENGFGYDPIFLPDGYHQSFGQLGLDIKNKISHRTIAVKKFIDFLQSRN
ncbi:MAG: RdgB/HAM1 family non-canonical purine NTP pyrophosphatase [Saprospiraceae bacterium]